MYLTGLKCKSAVLLAAKAANGQVSERLYLLPPDAQAERWTGVRAKPHEAAEKSGIEDIRFLNRFEDDFHALRQAGNMQICTLTFIGLTETSRIVRRIDCFTPFSEILRICKLKMRLS